MTRWMSVGVAVLAVLVAPAVSLACGDKYLVTSRGTRFERSGFVRTDARILVFAPPQGRLAPAFQSLELERAMTKVGYAPTVVDSRERLDDQLRAGKWEVILVELTDRQLVLTDLHSRDAQAAPVVVALAIGARGEEVKQARREIAAVVRSPGRASLVVDAIDQVLFDRALKERKAS